jgi:hypothetical protein
MLLLSTFFWGGEAVFLKKVNSNYLLMYKITIEPGKTRSQKIVTVFKKEKFLGLSYWNSIERVLCSNTAVKNHINHFTLKYNIVKERSNYEVVGEIQPVV